MTPGAAASRVAVVGAGLAGLACARALLDAGYQVSVFEREAIAGGRLRVERSALFAQCDLGAQYFTARNPGFRAQVALWEQAGVAALWTPRLAVFGPATGSGRGGPGVARFVGVPGMDAPAAWLARSLTIQTGTSVTALQRATGGWRLLTAEHGTLPTPFAAVVLALPAPQAAALLAGAPALAGLAKVAVAVPMQPCWAVVAGYAAPLELPFDAAFVNAGALRWVARDDSKPGRPARPTWLLHASAAWSAAHAGDDSAAVTATLLQAFADIGGKPPQTSVAYCWQAAIAGAASDAQCAWQAAEAVGLCGDWLHGGAVEGAWLSGQALARKMIGELGLPA